jgi:hypothetical protein
VAREPSRRGRRGLSGAQEQRRGEEKGGEERRKRETERKEREEKGKKEERRNGREKEREKERAREKRNEKKRGGSHRPRAFVIRALRETKGIAPALIAEKRSRVVVGRRAVRDGTAVKFGVGQKGLGLGF